MTVHFNLFGGTVLKLGTKKHHDLLLEKIGAPRCALNPRVNFLWPSGIWLRATVLHKLGGSKGQTVRVCGMKIEGFPRHAGP